MAELRSKNPKRQVYAPGRGLPLDELFHCGAASVHNVESAIAAAQRAIAQDQKLFRIVVVSS
jgi:hypothetical protein